MVAAGDVDGAAVAEMVNQPDTFELFVVVQATAGVVEVATGAAGDVTLLMVRLVLLSVRFDVSVTVMAYVLGPFGHVVELNSNCAVVRFVWELVQHPVDESKFP